MPETSEHRVGRREAMIQLLRLGGIGAGAAGVAVWLAGRSRRPVEPIPSATRPNFQIAPDAAFPAMVVVQGGDPAKLARRAFEEMGGIRRFIARGDVVTIKPNAAWDRTPEQAANTNPQLVGEVCRLCLEAGARRVMVADVSINDAQRSFARSGIAGAAHAAGAEVILPAPALFREVDLRGRVLNIWPVLAPFLTADKLINIPIAKHHSLTGATLGMKNWYGILGGPRQQLHQRIHGSLVDLADFMRPTVTLIDAYRVLLRNGPGGGSLTDVAFKKTLIAGTDPVALDAYAAQAYWNLDSGSLPYLQMASDRGLGTYRFENVATRFVTI